MVAELGSLKPLTEDSILHDFQFTINSLANMQGDFTNKLMKQGDVLSEAMEIMNASNANAGAIKKQAYFNDD